MWKVSDVTVVYGQEAVRQEWQGYFDLVMASKTFHGSILNVSMYTFGNSSSDLSLL